MQISENIKYVSKNACNQCTPLGACLALRGIERSMTIIHGAQGCATYIRRYLISHFREPVDIASSSFGEEAAIFGGKKNLLKSVENVIRQYNPSILGVATTCLSETIGDDLNMILKDLKEKNNPYIIPVSTPSYKGNHDEGFMLAVKSLVQSVAEGGTTGSHLNILPPVISPEDIRHLKEILNLFNASYTILPDYSDTLDGGIWKEYSKLPEGGTTIDALKASGRALATIEFEPDMGRVTAGNILKEKFNVRLVRQGLPIGLTATDKFMKNLSDILNKPLPDELRKMRARLIDAYADSHKYVFDAKAVVYGDPAMVTGIVSFLIEIGVKPVLCATGARNCNLEDSIKSNIDNPDDFNFKVIEGCDFGDIEEEAESLSPDLLIGNSKGHKIANKFGAKLIRTGFPIHDYFGGQRILHVGYKGTLSLLDRIVNSLLEIKQAKSPIIYNYM